MEKVKRESPTYDKRRAFVLKHLANKKMTASDLYHIAPSVFGRKLCKLSQTLTKMKDNGEVKKGSNASGMSDLFSLVHNIEFIVPNTGSFEQIPLEQVTMRAA